MSRTGSQGVRRFSYRRWLRALLWLLGILSAAFAAKLIGIRIVGDVEGWSRWLQAHRGSFLAWRVCMYAATLSGWWWMRQRLRQRERSCEARNRLYWTEAAAVLTVLALELSVYLQ